MFKETILQRETSRGRVPKPKGNDSKIWESVFIALVVWGPENNKKKNNWQRHYTIFIAL